MFPNNWLSTHAGGHIALYPMHCANRRRERRADVVEMLKAEYRVQNVIDYSGLEYDGVSLEGTAAVVLDHVARIAYPRVHVAPPPLPPSASAPISTSSPRVSTLLIAQGVPCITQRHDVHRYPISAGGVQLGL